MKQRMQLDQLEPGIYRAMEAADKAVGRFGLDPRLLQLIKLRASQLNGCGYCINEHSREARLAGETEQRVFAVSAWWETPFFSPAERAALRLCEEVTRIAQGGLSEETYREVAEHFTEQTIAQLLFAVAVINSWNRLAISVHMVAE